MWSDFIAFTMGGRNTQARGGGSGFNEQRHNLPGGNPLMSSKPNWDVMSYANGGIINEKVVGTGQESGKTYILGEKGPEKVTPMGTGGNIPWDKIISTAGRAYGSAKDRELARKGIGGKSAVTSMYERLDDIKAAETKWQQDITKHAIKQQISKEISDDPLKYEADLIGKINVAASKAAGMGGLMTNFGTGQKEAYEAARIKQIKGYEAAGYKFKTIKLGLNNETGMEEVFDIGADVPELNPVVNQKGVSVATDKGTLIVNENKFLPGKQAKSQDVQRGDILPEKYDRIAFPNGNVFPYDVIHKKSKRVFKSGELVPYELDVDKYEGK